MYMLATINKRLIITILAILALAFSFIMLTAPETGYAAAKQDVCESVGGTWKTDPNGVGSCDEQGGISVNKVIAAVINILSVIVGVIAVIMIIVGGLKYMTSVGDSNKTASARNTITYAIVGLILVALAQVIVRFVLGAII